MSRESLSESDYAFQLIEQIVRDCPQRRAGSEAERRAQELVRAELEGAGVATRLEPFDFCDNLYRVIALHFGAGLLGSLIGRRAPLAALGLHLFGASYWAHSTHRSSLVHPLLPRGRSQNLLATMPADGTAALRVVVAAHIDAGFTGLMFRSTSLHDLSATISSGGLDWLDQPLALATYSQVVLAGLDLLRLTGRARGKLSGLLGAGLSLPSLICSAPTWPGATRSCPVRTTTSPGSSLRCCWLVGSLRASLPMSSWCSPSLARKRWG